MVGCTRQNPHRRCDRTADRYRPDPVRLEIDGDRVERSLSELVTGRTFMVGAAERSAEDGEVINGESDVDQSLFTGEPKPVSKAAGDMVTGGTVNAEGTLICRVTATGYDSKLAQIIRLVETVQGARLPHSRFRR
ncbi:hypothetical protein OS189_05810 [Sulfitobacter sp. F26169L]|nr:hypothetical protein [Sulfitobacter sp. F26169L]